MVEIKQSVAFTQWPKSWPGNFSCLFHRFAQQIDPSVGNYLGRLDDKSRCQLDWFGNQTARRQQKNRRSPRQSSQNKIDHRLSSQQIHLFCANDNLPDVKSP